MAVHGLDVLSVYDPTTGEVVQLNSLGDGAEVKAAHPLDGDGVKSPTGNPYYGGDHSRISVPFVDEGAYEMLAMWQRQGRLLSAAGAGPAGALLWQERDMIRVRPEEVKGASGGARGWVLEMERRGHGAHRIWMDGNMLAGPVGPWLTAGGLGVGWEAISCYQNFQSAPLGGLNFADVPATAGANVRARERIVFPVAGVRLTASVAHAGASAGMTMELNVQAFGGGAVLASTYPELKGAEVPARISGSLMTPPGTWSVALNPLLTSAAFATTVWLYSPALRIGTSTEPGALTP